MYLKQSNTVFNFDTSDMVMLAKYFSDRKYSLKDTLIALKKEPLAKMIDEYYQLMELLQLAYDQFSTEFTFIVKGPKSMIRLDGLTRGLAKIWKYLFVVEEENTANMNTKPTNKKA